MTGYLWQPGQESAFLAAERAVESGGNYKAQNPGGASGAYQFEPDTWRYWVTKAGFPQFAGVPAAQAPPQVQDAAAGAMATSYYGQTGSLLTTAEDWYYPAVAGTPAAASFVPAGNTQTVLAYGQDVLAHISGAAANDAGQTSATLTGWSPAQLLPIITGGVAGDIPGSGSNPLGAIASPVVSWLDSYAIRAALFVIGAVALVVGLVHLTSGTAKGDDPLAKVDPFAKQTPATSPHSRPSGPGRTDTAAEPLAGAE